MSDDQWKNMIAGERMQVDQQFRDRLTASSFSNQQWGLVMTAVEFEIDDPESPDKATLRADTSKLSNVMGEIRQLGERSAGMGGGQRRTDSTGGLLNKLLDSLSLGGDSDDSDALRAEAETLVEAYTQKLQEHLKQRGRWESICAVASQD